MGKARGKRKVNRWKSDQRKGRQAAKFGFGPLNMPILLLVVVLAVGIYLFGSFNSLKGAGITNPLSKGASERLLVERAGVSSTLIVLEAPLDDRILSAWLFMNNEKNGSSIVYYIPGGVYVKDYSGVLDSYVSVADLQYAGDILDEKRSIEYAIWQINNLTGATIDSYIWVESEAVNNFSELFGDLSEFKSLDYSLKYSGAKDAPNSAFILNSFVDRLSLLNITLNHKAVAPIVTDISSSYGPIELLQRLLEVRGILGSGEVEMFDLSRPWATKEATTASGREIGVVDYPSVDKEFAKYTNIVQGREVEREQVKVEVYNASGIPEIAYRYARKIENAGMNVVRYENAPNEIAKTEIYVTRPEEFAYSLDLTKKLLVVEAKEVNSRPTFITTGDIVILLGQDMQQEISWE